MRKFKLAALALAGGMCWTGSSQAAVYITEWQYNGSEFFELTNFGPSSVDFTGWSFDDDSRAPGTVDLSGFGVVASGESVVLSEAAAADFRTLWGLSASVKVIGGNAANLGRNDEINIYDAANNLVDRLTYGDQNFSGSIRTDVNSGNPNSDAVLGTNNVLNWSFSTVADGFGSYSNGVNIGNPGSYPIPEPASLALVALGGLALTRRKRTA